MSASNPNLPVPSNTGQLPSFLQNKRGVAGLEGTKSSDLIFPRLNVMQSTSVPVQEGKFKAGDIVRQDTNEVFIPVGHEAVLVPIKFQREFLHWASRSSKRGIIERSTDENSPLAKKCAEALAQLFSTRKGVDTINEESYNESHSWLLTHKSDSGMRELLVISFAKGSIRESKQFISSIHQLQVPAFSLKFKITAQQRKNPKGIYYVPEPKRLGYVDEADFVEYEKMYEARS